MHSGFENGKYQALDIIQCAEPLIELGGKGERMSLRERSSPLVSIDFGSLAKYTRYPYGLILPQNITERVLTEALEALGVKVLRPYTVTDMKTNEQNRCVVDVLLDNGHVISARYVVGADGARSTVRAVQYTDHKVYSLCHQVRQLVGIGFADPDGHTDEHTNNLSQMVLADVRFSPDPIPLFPISEAEGEGVVSPNSFFLLIPLTSCASKYQNFDKVYRIACGVPMSSGTPPHAPTTAYLQDLVDKYGPAELCSDPSTNPHPVHISHNLWSARFRTHSAIAERFFTRFGTDNSAKSSSDLQSGAVIILVGDAAHIHSPAGGQGTQEKPLSHPLALPDV
jgi:2-polyprenyl-6-methoxyphenol hydroxylase-like FAD-dependent oxidoreductase